MLEIPRDDSGEKQSREDETSVCELRWGCGVEVGGEGTDPGDDLGEGDDGDEAAEPAGEDGFGFGLEIGLNVLEGFKNGCVGTSKGNRGFFRAQVSRRWMDWGSEKER